ncbi:hypothetical protein Nepgr_025936 [Nepenthes gracilis]|uniref:Secreted protein n=1 Tax=Nepenthes gracilis TaxID=150966 RepID=A0AAD3T5X8_NEPGR|nr:hypothetical protein Nepgr_025936 [Nepenthes gracilis]
MHDRITVSLLPLVHLLLSPVPPPPPQCRLRRPPLPSEQTASAHNASPSCTQPHPPLSQNFVSVAPQQLSVSAAPVAIAAITLDSNSLV